MIDNPLMLFCLFKLMAKKKKQRKHSRYRKVFFNNLSAVQQSLRDRRLPRIALQAPSHSPWKTLLYSGSNQALITFTGLDFATFHWLVQRFRPIYERNSQFIDPNRNIVPLENPGRGRKRLIAAEDCLGLTLAWTRTRGASMACS